MESDANNPNSTIRYADARPRIASGDIGLVRGNTLIAWYGRSAYRHALVCCWRNADQSTLAAAESREWVGGRVVSLSELVRQYPGQIDIWTPTEEVPEVLRERAATLAFNWAGHGYNYPGIAQNLLVHYPRLRRLAGRLGAPITTAAIADMTPGPFEARKFCSQLAVWAYRRSKRELGATRRKFSWDLCPLLNEAFAQPGDLARGGGLRLKFAGLTP